MFVRGDRRRLALAAGAAGLVLLASLGGAVQPTGASSERAAPAFS
jgi:hypothetical protein